MIKAITSNIYTASLDWVRNVGEAVEGPPTNNVGEIEAATKAIQIARTCGKKERKLYENLV